MYLLARDIPNMPNKHLINELHMNLENKKAITLQVRSDFFISITKFSL